MLLLSSTTPYCHYHFHPVIVLQDAVRVPAAWHDFVIDFHSHAPVRQPQVMQQRGHARGSIKNLFTAIQENLHAVCRQYTVKLPLRNLRKTLYAILSLADRKCSYGPLQAGVVQW